MANDNSVINHEQDSVGSDLITFRSLLYNIAHIFKLKRLIITNIPNSICYLLTKPLDLYFQDKLIEKDDYLLMINGLTRSY